MKDALIHVPINQLQLSKSVIDACEKNEILNMSDLLKYSYAELLNLQGFHMGVVVEVLTFIKANGFESMLKD